MDTLTDFTAGQVYRLRPATRNCFWAHVSLEQPYPDRNLPVNLHLATQEPRDSPAMTASNCSRNVRQTAPSPPCSAVDDLESLQ